MHQHSHPAAVAVIFGRHDARGVRKIGHAESAIFDFHQLPGCRIEGRRNGEILITVFGFDVGVATVQCFAPYQSRRFAGLPIHVARAGANALDRNVLIHWKVSNLVDDITFQVPDLNRSRETAIGQQVAVRLLNRRDENKFSVRGRADAGKHFGRTNFANGTIHSQDCQLGFCVVVKQAFVISCWSIGPGRCESVKCCHRIPECWARPESRWVPVRQLGCLAPICKAHALRRASSQTRP